MENEEARPIFSRVLTAFKSTLFVSVFCEKTICCTYELTKSAAQVNKTAVFASAVAFCAAREAKLSKITVCKALSFVMEKNFSQYRSASFFKHTKLFCTVSHAKSENCAS